MTDAKPTNEQIAEMIGENKNRCPSLMPNNKQCQYWTRERGIYQVCNSGCSAYNKYISQLDYLHNCNDAQRVLGWIKKQRWPEAWLLRFRFEKHLNDLTGRTNQSADDLLLILNATPREICYAAWKAKHDV